MRKQATPLPSSYETGLGIPLNLPRDLVKQKSKVPGPWEVLNIKKLGQAATVSSGD